MTRARKAFAVGLVAAVVVLTVAGFRFVASDDDEPLTGTELQQAEAAALVAVGSGEVVEAEVGDGGAAYEVEIRLPDGRQVEVELDHDFGVIATGADDDGTTDDEADDGD